MTIPYVFLIVFLLLQVLTLYFVVCLVTDLSRHDSRLDSVRDTVNGLAHRVWLLQRGSEITEERLNDLTQTVKSTEDDIVYIGEQLGFFDRAPDPVEAGPSEEDRARCGEDVQVTTFDDQLVSGEKAERSESTFTSSDYPGTAPHVTFAEGGGHD